MTYKQFLFNCFNKTLKFIFNLNKPNKLSCSFAENLDLVYHYKQKGLDIKIACPNMLNLWRAETYLTKEPDMIEWLDSFDENCTLLDIGANIGLYSVYAAKKGIKRVISIEPESQNYSLLNKNIYLNNLSHKVTALNIGFSDHDGLESLFIPKFEAGNALNNLGESIDWKKEKFQSDFQQSVMSYSIDSFLSKFPELFPTHIKIDVDGIERKIIEGGRNTLKDSRVKQLLIELNTELKDDMEIIEIMKECGFKVKSTRNVMPAGTTFGLVCNYIFVKE
jgi:FkbM family methyltransferase